MTGFKPPQFPEFNIAETLKSPPVNVRGTVDSGDLASTFYDRLEEGIKDFETNTVEDEHIEAHVVLSNGETIVAYDFGYHNPNLFYIWGLDSQGNEVSVLAHVSTVQVVMRRLKNTPDHPKREIGFSGNVYPDDLKD